ncbi:MAG TPA: hypothetical protein VL691_00045 [Vicinamibacteria bacterium]|nr:hypothetical protein [Vicinamibacteria bacterium]
MKTELKSEDGPEREELRSFLRHWDVPEPPPEIEEELRQTFRRRHAPRRPALRLSLAAAAALAVLALWWAGTKGRAVTPAPPGRPIAAATPLPPSPAAVASAVQPATRSSSGIKGSSASATGRRRGPSPSPRPAEVVVEPEQARLLADLGRKLRDVRAAAPATSVPRVEVVSADRPPTPILAVVATDVLRYRAGWETVAGEWPSVQRSVPITGR